MTDLNISPVTENTMTHSELTTRQKVTASMARRRAAESRFKMFGVASILFGLLCLVVLFSDIISKGASAFTQTVVTMDVMIDADYLDLTLDSTAEEIQRANFGGLVKRHLKATMQPQNRRERRTLYKMISAGS